MVHSIVSGAGLSAWKPFIPAIIGLAGVLIGGAITAGANYIIAVRQERNLQERQVFERKREVRRYARILRHDFVGASSHAAIALSTGKWIKESYFEFGEGWTEARHVMAAELKFVEWIAVTNAVVHVGMMNKIYVETARLLTEKDRELLERVRANCQAAQKILDRLADD
jgi:hypothetical protein